ncbi:hypothetical protein IDM40_05020 [Nocardiopsis sp. HNM0947]|uniref:Guanylate cyclase domain-containing protein n=1 Tax=Nocardiopsis coralli TaxID=2772213 RepID=A0ABR9P2L2_9ACTN|nr:hypothetical protein [Nocardiopsis coralli]MBE2998069.1 hypothetical protein [Nocardiopsis coralli]
MVRTPDHNNAGEHSSPDDGEEFTALFADMRGSTGIVEFVERHHGLNAAAELFQVFLSECVRLVEDIDGAEVHLRGDGVLILFSGADRVQDAVEYTRRLRHMVDDPPDELVRHLRCGCTTCPVCGEETSLSLEVRCGIDAGRVSRFKVQTLRDTVEELVGSCISVAAKLSGALGEAHRVGMSRRAWRRLHQENGTDARLDREWTPSAGQIGQRRRRFFAS